MDSSTPMLLDYSLLMKYTLKGWSIRTGNKLIHKKYSITIRPDITQINSRKNFNLENSVFQVY